ncbi:TPR-REGION domain-containing protein [Mycena chlorophos]|uniref:TPR-REGION domain-containing protein n=1 Tax=Mycena chlorophos TaxID=658473 RepID=A0A8H6W809_MYCCL|nr:TPR-REGION domain-containing protein [Mycena chlorophos]
MTDKAELVDSLKKEGNVFFQKRDFKAAYQKYTEAINECEDQKILAVLYSNRSAASMSMKEYMDAIHDGQTSTKADPTFVKGYTRTGTAADAIGMFTISLRAWKAALECTTDPLIKTDCEAKIKAVKAERERQEKALSNGGNHEVISAHRASQDAPWVRALRLMQQNRLPPGSSGFVVREAYEEYTAAVDTMRKTRMEMRQGQQAIVCEGKVTDLESMPNTRWLTLTLQVQVEVQGSGGFTCGPTELIKEVPERLKGSNWNAVRPALTITIRSWLLQACLDSKLMGRESTADEFFRRVIDVLVWGRRTYASVPRMERGAIFEITILNAVRRLRLQNLLAVYSLKEGECGYSLDEIEEIAQELKTETDPNLRPGPSTVESPGFFAFWTYPRAEAISVLGWVHMRRGLEHLLRSEEAQDQETAEAALLDSMKAFYKSYSLYVEAAELYPEDDQGQPYLLSVAFEALMRSHAPLRLTLPLARRISVAVTKASAIWELEMSSAPHTAKYNEAAEFLRESEREIAKGNWKLTDCLGIAHYDSHPRSYSKQKEAQEHEQEDDGELEALAAAVDLRQDEEGIVRLCSSFAKARRVYATQSDTIATSSSSVFLSPSFPNFSQRPQIAQGRKRQDASTYPT